MKNNVQSIIACLCLSLFLASCQDTSKPVVTTPETKPVMAVKPPNEKDIAENIKVSSYDKPIFVAYAEGTQVYKCDSIAPGKFVWKFDRPEATLYDDQHKQIGTHYKSTGPTWESEDGSIIVANGDKATIQEDTAHAGVIPWLLLVKKETKGNANGVFSHVSKIQRLYTEHGKKPSGLVDPSNKGTELYVYYKATYYFYDSYATK